MRMRVRTKDDIIALLQEFRPDYILEAPNSIVTATFREGDADVVLTAETTSKSKRDIIIDGLANLKKMIEHRGDERGSSYIEHILKATHPVDSDIENLLGARRCGINIVWDLPSGHYVYNIYDHKLVRQDDAPEG